jgi:hypothetical protein
LQSLLVRTELAGRHFLLRIDCKTRSGRKSTIRAAARNAQRDMLNPRSP